MSFNLSAGSNERFKKKERERQNGVNWHQSIWFRFQGNYKKSIISHELKKLINIVNRCWTINASHWKCNMCSVHKWMCKNFYCKILMDQYFFWLGAMRHASYQFLQIIHFDFWFVLFLCLQCDLQLTIVSDRRTLADVFVRAQKSLIDS